MKPPAKAAAPAPAAKAVPAELGGAPAAKAVPAELGGVPAELGGGAPAAGQKSSALYPCDEVCQKKCDEEYDLMVRDPAITNPLPFITWNCKNNYDVYTTDYDPHFSWFDKASGDIMDVQRIMGKIQRLENREISGTETAVLRELKKEVGLNPEEPAGALNGLNVREMVEDAAAQHAAVPRSPGFIKAKGLENRMDWSDDQGFGASERSVNW